MGSTGISYNGATADFLVVNGHPSVKAIIPQFSLYDAYTDIAFPGGAHSTWFTEAWHLYNSALDRKVLPDRQKKRIGFLGSMAAKGVCHASICPLSRGNDPSPFRAGVRP